MRALLEISQKQTLFLSNRVYNRRRHFKTETMPGLRAGLQTFAVSDGYDPSFEHHAKFGTLIKIRRKQTVTKHTTECTLNNM